MEVGGRRAIFVSGTYLEPPKSQSPSLLRYVMKKGFGKLYWSTMHGSWEWMFRMYFGKTSTRQKEREDFQLPALYNPIQKYVNS
jgi:hypothetical protein